MQAPMMQLSLIKLERESKPLNHNLDYGAAAGQENQTFTETSGCSSFEVLYQNLYMEQNPAYKATRTSNVELQSCDVHKVAEV